MYVYKHSLPASLSVSVSDVMEPCHAAGWHDDGTLGCETAKQII